MHWTKRPENAKRVEQVLSKMREGHKKHFSKPKTTRADTVIAEGLRKFRESRQPREEESVLVLNGWRITVGRGSVKIEQA